MLAEIIKFTHSNEQLIRDEFKKMVDFYSNNPESLINVLLDVKYDIKNEDFFSDKITHGLEATLDNVGNNTWYFDENMLLDSIQKVYNQFKQVPQEILNKTKDIKIFFYDISEEPDQFGIRLMTSTLITDWRNFLQLYSSINN